MTAIQSWAIAYLLNSLWQVPLIFTAAWILARLARPISPRTEHRVWVGALIVQTLLPACQFDLNTLWQKAYALIASILGGNVGRGQVHVIVGPGIAYTPGLLRIPASLLAAILIAYACVVLYFIGRLAFGLWKTTAMSREAKSLTLTSALTGKLSRYDNLLNAESTNFAIATSPMISGPVTVGIRRALLLFPPGFLDHVSDSDLDAVLAHEFAHMQRHDFAKNLLYEILSLAAAYHPVLWITRSRLAETREIVCDSIAAETIQGRENYARSLLRLASILSDRTPVRPLHAIGIFDANIFERRIMNLAQKRIEISRARRFAIASACALLAVATCASALALRMDVFPSAAQTDHPKRITVKSDDLKIVTRVNPVYPPDAKKAKIEGAVKLSVIISKEGVPENIAVQSGPKELQKSALDAVRQWTWEPVLLNGNTIEVETTITIVYELAG